MTSCINSTATVPITDLIPDVLMHLPEVPDIIIENALRRKAVEFSNRVRNLTCDLRINTQEGVVGYPIELPNGAIPRSIKDVVACGQCHSAIEKCATPTTRGYMLSDDISWIDLNPPPPRDEFEGLCMTVAYVLSMESACEIPREYFDQYATTIVDGALSILLSNVDQEWASRTSSEYRDREFRRGISEAREDLVAERYGNGGIPIRTRPFLV